MTNPRQAEYSVFDESGNKICDTPSVRDALMMASFKEGRTYKKNKILSDQVVNISSSKMEDDKQLNPQNILPDRTAEPFIV
jgi:hypothetical protein